VRTPSPDARLGLNGKPKYDLIDEVMWVLKEHLQSHQVGTVATYDDAAVPKLWENGLAGAVSGPIIGPFTRQSRGPMWAFQRSSHFLNSRHARIPGIDVTTRPSLGRLSCSAWIDFTPSHV
jgi:hypothetical protein